MYTRCGARARRFYCGLGSPPRRAPTSAARRVGVNSTRSQSRQPSRRRQSSQRRQRHRRRQGHRGAGVGKQGRGER
eukprot:3183461-Pyramimonas_sp.AAC.1